MQRCRILLVQKDIRSALGTLPDVAQTLAIASHGHSTAAVTLLAAGRHTRVAPIASLAALQHLAPRRQPKGLIRVPGGADDNAGCTSTRPALAAVGQRLVHSRPALGEPAESATHASARHPAPAFTADEGLTAAAAEAAQLAVASADDPAAAQLGAHAESTPSGDPVSAANGTPQISAADEGGRVPEAHGKGIAARASAPRKHASAKRSAAAPAADRGSDTARVWRPNSRLPPVDYTPAVETAVLDFWRRRGLLLSAEAVTNAATAGEQQKLRRRVLRFAKKSSHHRDVPQLEQRMARWDAAKLEEGWSGDVNRTAMADIRALGRDPFTQLGKLKLITAMFGRFGISNLSVPSTFQLLSFRPETLETAVPKFLEAARSWDFGRDPTILLQKTPTLLQCADFSTHTARVAALRRLHPELDVGRVLWGQPSILKLRGETLQQQWDRLRDAAGLDDDQMKTLVEYSASVLKRKPETLRRKLQDVSRFDAARAAAGLPPPPQFKFPAWLSNMLAKSQLRFLRLTFLLEQARDGQETALAQPALTVVEHPDTRFNRLWPGFSTWCVQHVAAGDNSVSDSSAGLGSESSADGRRARNSDGSESDSD